MINDLDTTIAQYIDFFECIDGPPLYDDLEADAQNAMCAAHLLNSDEKLGAELFERIAESKPWRDPRLVAEVIQVRDEWNVRLTDHPWGPLVALLRCAAEETCKREINARIEDLFADYCDANGIYSIAGAEPDELVGFKDEIEVPAFLKEQAE